MVSRRNFAQSLSLLLAAPWRAAAARVRRRPASAVSEPDVRRAEALQLRQTLAARQASIPAMPQTPNADEALPGHIASFSKGLPHQQNGEVDDAAYRTLSRAVDMGDSAEFAKISRGSGRTLVNPQAAYAFDLEGGDPHRFAAPAAPSFSSPAASAETVELYWAALARDLPFSEYETSPLIARACADLNRMEDYRGPKPQGTVTPGSIFRGLTAGDLWGPYLSQFLVQPVPLNSGYFEQRYASPAPGVDYMTSYGEWLQIQMGVPPWREPVFEETPRYIRTGRDLAEYIHYDYLSEPFVNAALILLRYGPQYILGGSVEYLSDNNPYKRSTIEGGFVTLGLSDLFAGLAKVTNIALKATWAQKWLVHRRLRPEVMGARLHANLQNGATYPLHEQLAASDAVKQTLAKYGTALLPQSYPEGAPLHPAYPAGHATVAGACSALLKAYFREDQLVANAVVPGAGGTKLDPRSEVALTVGGEIDKLAFNVAMGRNFAGIHYRSDAAAGLAVGEEVAISCMQDWVECLHEDFPGFRFTRLDGRIVEVRKQLET